MDGTEIKINIPANDRIYTMVVRPDYTKLEDTKNVEENFHININVFYRENGEKHEIVRIDNSHDYMHIHRLYSSQEDEREAVNMNYWEAMEYLRENLDQFAQLYDENHR